MRTWSDDSANRLNFLLEDTTERPRPRELPLVASRLLWFLIGAAVGIGAATAIVLFTQ